MVPVELLFMFPLASVVPWFGVLGLAGIAPLVVGAGFCVCGSVVAPVAGVVV